MVWRTSSIWPVRRARLLGLIGGLAVAQVIVLPPAQANPRAAVCLSASFQVGFDRALLPGADAVATSVQGSVKHCSVPSLITGKLLSSNALTSGCAQTSTTGTALLGLNIGLTPITFTVNTNTGKGPVLLTGTVDSGPLAGYSVTGASATAPHSGDPCSGDGLTGYTLATDLILTPPGTPAGASERAAFGPAIVGGQQADIEQFPFTASVRIYDQHICGGSILSSTTVLTAAHCVYGMDWSQYSVRVGNSYHASGTSYRVSEVRMNHYYNPDTLDSDVAILKLAGPLAFSSRVQPISLARTAIPVGSTAWVSGWGALSEGGQSPSSLRAVDVAILSATNCNSAYGTGVITPKMICAQTPGHDSCQGDSGGPLVVGDRQVGIVSWGYGCARPAYPGVYADVAALYNWIADNSY
jgi:trypsin